MSKFVIWAENYLYCPNTFQKILSFILLPVSFIYCLITYLKRVLSKEKDLGISVISVGNLTLGGNGKTPITMHLAQDFKKPCIILRGYKRESSGLIVVSEFGNLKTNISQSGDEAMLYALMLKHSLVIVSEDRVKAIQKAKQMGADIVFLDDGFSKAHIKKLDILIQPNPYPTNHFCLPSGGFREHKNAVKYADIILQEGLNFTKQTSITNIQNNMVLLTSIAKASRLDIYLPKNVKHKYIFADHYSFNFHELKQILEKTEADSLLVTRKDWVKIKDFNLPISILELQINMNLEIKQKVLHYYKQYKQCKII